MRALEQGSGGTVSKIERLASLLDSGEVKWAELSDKGKAAYFDYAIQTGRIKKDELSDKGLGLLVKYNMPSAQDIRRTIELAQTGRYTPGVPIEEQAPKPMTYAAGQFAKNLYAPFPITNIQAPRSGAEQALGFVTGTAGMLASPLMRAAGALSKLAPAASGAIRLGTLSAGQQAQRALSGEDVSAKEALSNVAISAAVGGVSDILAPIMRISVQNTLAKHFPETLPKALDKAIPYATPVAVGATVGAGRAAARNVGKWVTGEPVDISQAVKEIGAEAAVFAAVNATLAAIGIVPKGSTSDYYKFAKKLIEVGATPENRTFLEFPGKQGIGFQYDPKTATIRYQFETVGQGDIAVPKFMSETTAISLQKPAVPQSPLAPSVTPSVTQNVSPQASVTLPAPQSSAPTPPQLIVPQARPTTMPQAVAPAIPTAPAPVKVAVPQAQPSIVKPAIKVGDTVYSNGTPLTVVNASDPSLLTVKNELGTTLKIGRGVVTTQPSTTQPAVQTPAKEVAATKVETAKAEPAKTEVVAKKEDKPVPDLPIAVSPNDISYDTAYNAHRWNSMVPDERAKGIQNEYVQHIREIYDELKSLAETDAQRDILRDELERYKQGYLKHMNAILAARSRTASSMVTGPANFPTRRNQKALDSEMQRYDEMRAWQGKAISSIRRKLKGTMTAEQTTSKEFERLKRDIDETIATLKGIETGEMRGLDPALFKSSLAGKIQRSHDAAAVKDALEYLRKTQNEVLSKPAFTDRHSIWSFVPKEAAIGQGVILEREGVRVVNNGDIDRVQIFLDDKPSAEFRNALKSAGWKWSPKNSAWQRKRTANALSSAKRIVGEHMTATEVSPDHLKQAVADVDAFAAPRPAIPKGQPVTPTVPVKRSDIVKALREKLDIPIRIGRLPKTKLGIFKRQPHVIRTRLANDLPVIAHEVGHYLDKVLGLGEPQYDSELLKVGRKTSPPSYPQYRVRREGVAEFTRLYLTDEAEAQKQAPTFFAAFEQKVAQNPDIQDILLRARQDIYNWMNQPAVARILGSLSVGEKERRPVTLDRLYTAIVDELHPLKNAVKAMTGGQPIPITKDPFKLAWLARGSTGKAEAFLKYAVLDGDFKKVGPSLQQVLKPVEKRLDEFRAYAIAKRALELEARNIETGIDPKDATEVVNQFGKDFDPVFRKLVEFQDQVLEQTLVASGIITPEQAALMRQMNQDYVPFYRLFDEKLGATVGFRDSKGYANLSNPIKRLKGSARDIVDPLESIVKNTYAMVNLASRNEVGKALVELAEAKTGAGKWAEKIPTPKFGTKFKLSEIQNQLEAIGVDTTGIDLSKSLATIFRPTNLPPGKENVVTVFRNGEREYWQLEPELYRAMLSMDKESMGILVRILSVPANILRAGATLAPEFVIKNPTKDQLDAYLYSKFGYKPGVDFVRGLFHAVKKDDLFWKWQASGGAQASIVSMDRDYMQNTLVGLLASGAKKVGYQMSHPIELLRSLVEWNETGTRLGEFKRGVKANPTTEGILEAALASRDLIDFSRKGAATAEARRTVPFFNAAIQGTDKMIRAMRDNPKQFTIRALTAITLPTLIFYAMCRKNRKYDELSLKEKDLYWHLPVGPSPEADLLRIPKPHEPGILFGSTIERAMRYIDTQDPKAFDELGERLITEALPSFWPQFIAPYLEAKQNERIYSGVPIVPQREQDLPPEMQYGPYTSDTAKWLGEKIRQSPRIIEHYVNAYGGGLARLGLEGADFVTRLLTGEEEVPRAGRGLADVPGLRAFATTPYQNPQSVSEFYDELERLRKEEQRVKAKGDRMKPDDGVLLQRLEMASKTLAEIHKRQRAIEASTTMTAERKRTELDKLTEYEIRVARQALGKEPLGSK